MPPSFSKLEIRIIILLGLLTAIGPFSIDMYLPAFSAIAISLHTSVEKVTLSLSSFFIGICAGQLLYGPLLERFGRKRPLYAGLLLYFIASIACAWAQSIELLIAARLLQALGGCVGMVAARAMVRDVFEVQHNARVFSLLMLVVSVSPILAPTLGGYITQWLGWRYVFGVLIAVVLLIMVGTYLFLPETKAPNNLYSLKPPHILGSFAAILKHPQFMVYALTGALSYAGLYAYIGGAPYVFMQLYGATEAQFGWIFAFVAAGLIGASQINSIMLRSKRSQWLIVRASAFQCMVGLLMVLSTVFHLDSLYVMIALVFLFLCCQGFLFPNTTALALAPMPHAAGNASALVGALQMGLGALAAAVIALWHNGTAIPLTVIMCCCAWLAFGMYYLGNRWLLKAWCPAKPET